MESNTVLYKPLGELIDLLTDYHANGAYEKLKDNVTLLDKEDHAVMIRTTNFEANDFTNNLIYIDEHAYKFLKKSKVYASDLIMNKIANPGTVYFMPEIGKPVSLGMNLFLIRINLKKANPYFIYAYLRKNEYYVKSFASGSTTKTITKEDVRRLKIYTPPLVEQNEVAQILSTWDQAISATEKLLKNSQQQKKALMQQLLTGKKRLLDENGVRFSNDWNKLEIGELLAESRIPSENNDPSKRLTVRLNLKGIQPRACRGTEAVDSTTHFIRSAGQFIYGKQNIHKGAFGIIPYDLNGYETSQDLPAFDFTKKCDPSWFLHYVSQESFYTSLEDKMSGTGSKRLNPKTLFKMKIACPNREEQQKIAAFLSVADQKILVIQKKLDCLKQEKKALMQQLLTGKKRVKVAA